MIATLLSGVQRSMCLLGMRIEMTFDFNLKAVFMMKEERKAVVMCQSIKAGRRKNLSLNQLQWIIASVGTFCGDESGVFDHASANHGWTVFVGLVTSTNKNVSVGGGCCSDFGLQLKLQYWTKRRWSSSIVRRNVSKRYGFFRAQCKCMGRLYPGTKGQRIIIYKI
uniref:Uncharacterized protein n=1 Tax=Cucumis melo TaxID=3656 RepID=A0A9I9ED84_CUCME